MTKYLIAHHLGLGDHIVLNGLVRHIYAREKANGKEVYLLCYQHNARNVSRMYDDTDIKFLFIDNSYQISDAIARFDGEKEDLHLVGDIKYQYADYGDEAFFFNFGYDVNLLTSFSIRRDLEKEMKVMEKLTGGEEYIFVHDDLERGFPIDENKLPNGLKIVRAEKDIPMFDLLMTMEYAKECHVISSSFLCICIANKFDNCIAHLYMRNQYLEKYLNKYGIKTLV